MIVIEINAKVNNMEMSKILRPDTKGRICLGSLTKGISGYKAIIDEETHEILLKPYTEILLSEQWLFDNTEALESVKRGLKQSSKQKTSYKGSFSKYAEDDQ